MKSFADWTRERASLEQNALSLASAELELESFRAAEEAQLLLEELTLALVDDIALTHELAASNRVLANSRQWMAGIEDEFRSQLDSQLKQIEDRLSGKVADVIIPLMTEAMQKKAVEDFCATLKQNVTPVVRQEFVVRAPPEIQGLLEKQLLKGNLNVRIEPSDSGEFETHLSGMVIETTLSEWTERLREMIGK